MEHHATVLTCAALRQEYREDRSISALAEEYSLDQATVRYHLYADCDHDITEAPITPPGASLDRRDCEQIRTLATDGRSLSDIAETLNQTEEAVIDHATGFCDHEETGPTVERAILTQSNPRAAPISSAKCAELRKRLNDVETVRELADQTTWSYATIAQHVRGDCGHDIAVPPRESRERNSIDESDCKRLRQRYREASSVRRVAEETNWNYQTVLKHIDGDCSHDVSIQPRQKDQRAQIDSEQCRRLRAEYQEDVDITPKKMASQRDIPESAIQRHVHLQCEHPVDEAVVRLLEQAGLSEAAAEAKTHN